MRRLIYTSVALLIGCAGLAVWPLLPTRVQSASDVTHHATRSAGLSSISQQEALARLQRQGSPGSPAEPANTLDDDAALAAQQFVEAVERVNRADHGSAAERAAMQDMAAAMEQFGKLGDEDREKVASAWSDFARVRAEREKGD